jgi:hypothetical protein
LVPVLRQQYNRLKSQEIHKGEGKKKGKRGMEEEGRGREQSKHVWVIASVTSPSFSFPFSPTFPFFLLFKD